MKKIKLRELLRSRDKDGNKIVVLGTEKPEIIPFDEGGFTTDKNGDIKEVRVKPKKAKGDK